MSQVSHFVHRPASHLRRYVREILWVRSRHARTQILLPETTLTMTLRLAGSASLRNETLPAAVVSGLQQRARSVAHAPGSSLLVVRFTEIGAAAILHNRVDLLYNLTLPLDAALPRPQIDRIQNILADTPQIPQQLSAVENFLAERIRPRDEVSPQVETAIRIIRNSNGQLPIAAVARRAAMSRSALERQFRAAVGTTPKSFSRLARLQHICRLWDEGKNMTEVAIEAGYFDQPHLVHDFRLFTGTSPEQFFRHAAPRNLPTFYK